MEDNETILPGESPMQAPRLPEPMVAQVLLAQIGLMILCSGAGMLLYMLICKTLGWDPQLALHETSPAPERWQIRLQLGMAHFFGFFGSGALTVWIFYRGITQNRTSWPDYLRSRNWPPASTLLLSLLLMLVSVPLVLYTLNLNQQLPLPELFKSAEDQAETALKGLLQMEHIGELLANLSLIALLPALGEELVFRGVIQQQIMRRIPNPWTAILLASVIFSAAHMQFEGFIPRMLLGFILGWLYWQTRNFWVPVLCHFFNNGLQVLGQYLYKQDLTAVDLEKDVQVPWPFAAISLFMVWAVVRLIRQNLTKTSVAS
ncbi:MAG TPA: CPBP family intramembrane glutamic endopeptidase [Saprospiraceae bacterium]|nr:CPBP family intramembrane glutamic endopeptidase [Saprospiraceae bacterium]